MRDHCDASAVVATRVTPAQHVVTTRLGDELVLLDVERGDYYTLNETAARVWELLASAGGAGLSADAVAKSLTQEYATPASQLESDVRALIAEFSKSALVVPVAARLGEHW